MVGHNNHLVVRGHQEFEMDLAEQFASFVIVAARRADPITRAIVSYLEAVIALGISLVKVVENGNEAVLAIEGFPEPKLDGRNE
jgi:hypothetical protein